MTKDLIWKLVAKESMKFCMKKLLWAAKSFSPSFKKKTVLALPFLHTIYKYFSTWYFVSSGLGHVVLPVILSRLKILRFLSISCQYSETLL